MDKKFNRFSLAARCLPAGTAALRLFSFATLLVLLLSFVAALFCAVFPTASAKPEKPQYDFPVGPTTTLQMTTTTAGGGTEYIDDSVGALDYGWVGVVGEDTLKNWKMIVSGLKITKPQNSDFSSTVTGVGKLYTRIHSSSSSEFKWCKQDCSYDGGVVGQTEIHDDAKYTYNGVTYCVSFTENQMIENRTGPPRTQWPEKNGSNSWYKYSLTYKCLINPKADVLFNGNVLKQVEGSGDNSAVMNYTVESEKEYCAFGAHLPGTISGTGFQGKRYGFFSKPPATYDELYTHAHNQMAFSYIESKRKGSPNEQEKELNEMLDRILNGHPITGYASGYDPGRHGTVSPDGTNSNIGVWQWDKADNEAYNALKITDANMPGPSYYYNLESEVIKMSEITHENAESHYGKYELAVNQDPSPDKAFYVSLISAPTQAYEISPSGGSDIHQNRVYIDVYTAGNRDLELTLGGSGMEPSSELGGNSLTPRKKGYFTDSNKNDPTETMGNLELYLGAVTDGTVTGLSSDTDIVGLSEGHKIIIKAGERRKVQIPLVLRNGNAVTQTETGLLTVPLNIKVVGNTAQAQGRSSELHVHLNSVPPSLSVSVPAEIRMELAADGSAKFFDENSAEKTHFEIVNHSSVPVWGEVSNKISEQSDSFGHQGSAPFDLSPLSLKLKTLPQGSASMEVPFSPTLSSVPVASDWKLLLQSDNFIPTENAASPSDNILSFIIEHSGVPPKQTSVTEPQYHYKINYRFGLCYMPPS